MSGGLMMKNLDKETTEATITSSRVACLSPPLQSDYIHSTSRGRFANILYLYFCIRVKSFRAVLREPDLFSFLDQRSLMPSRGVQTYNLITSLPATKIPIRYTSTFYCNSSSHRKPSLLSGKVSLHCW